jgi:DDE family transposase
VAIPVPAVSHVAPLLTTHLPLLRPAQQRGLAEWVAGTLLAGSSCEAAVLAALAPLGWPEHATRARLREVLCDGADRADPCAVSLDVEACFAPLLAWVLAWWIGDTLPLAVDATSRRERDVVLSLSVLYRGSAIPVAWAVVPHRGKGAWLPHLERLLALLAPAVPAARTVVVLTDRGLWSPRLWRAIQANGWHPLMRIRPDATFAPTGRRRQRAQELIPGPGWCWVGAGVAYKHKPKRLASTLVVVWGTGQTEPWLLLTDLAPDAVEGSWYGLRVWIELGFRALKSFGWQWERTRRADPVRIARHWLVLAIATLLSLAVGTRLEEAALGGRPPGKLRRPRSHTSPPPRRRRVSLFTRGRVWWQVWIVRGRRGWRALWLWPEALPTLAADLQLIRHLASQGAAHA